MYRCGDCGKFEGEFHDTHCDMEYCSVHNCQLLVCGCDPNKIHRFPVIEYAFYCVRCGERMPDLFGVPDEVWEYYITPRERDEVICKKCFEEIVEIFKKVGLYHEYVYVYG